MIGIVNPVINNTPTKLGCWMSFFQITHSNASYASNAPFVQFIKCYF